MFHEDSPFDFFIHTYEYTAKSGKINHDGPFFYLFFKSFLFFDWNFLNLMLKYKELITPWCNGSTSGFGPLSSGSNPDGVTIFCFKPIDLLHINIFKTFPFDLIAEYFSDSFQQTFQTFQTVFMSFGIQRGPMSQNGVMQSPLHKIT